MTLLVRNFKYFYLKGKVIDLSILSKLVLISIAKSRKTEQKPKLNIFKTKNSKSIVLPIYKDCIFFVYNGLKYQKLRIVEDFFGFKLGDFILTRRFIGHKRQYKPTKSGIRNKKQLVKRNTRVLKKHAFFSTLIYLEKQKFLKLC